MTSMTWIKNNIWEDPMKSNGGKLRLKCELVDHFIHCIDFHSTLISSRKIENKIFLEQKRIFFLRFRYSRFKFLSYSHFIKIRNILVKPFINEIYYRLLRHLRKKLTKQFRKFSCTLLFPHLSFFDWNNEGV